MSRFVAFALGIMLSPLMTLGISAAENRDDASAAPSQATIAALRARGPEGLAQALARYDELDGRRRALLTAVTRQSQSPSSQITTKGSAGQNGDLRSAGRQLEEVYAALEAWSTAIDLIGGQRYCDVSRLYWYTNLDEAKQQSARTGLPILSLRMLGKLTDEYSCANSRFFRTALYSHPEISDYLRQNYVLHWQSVRPVPKVTIDFGDGRRLERTLTGNSAHYVLTSDGRPLDVLPGLYGPQEFHEWLARMHEFHSEYVATSESRRPKALSVFHRRRGQELVQQWERDIRQVGGPQLEALLVRIADSPAFNNLRNGRNEAPTAIQAAPMAVGKGFVETPVLRFANLGGGRAIEESMNEELWQGIAALRRADVRLAPASVELMRNEYPSAADAGQRAFGKKRVEDPVLRMVRSFENSLALDTVRNEYLLHRRIHEQFLAGEPVTANYDELNEWVYAELFLTPSSDPWLGLAPPDVYTALENGGARVPAGQVRVAE